MGETVGVQDIANSIVEKISDFVHGGQDSGGTQGGHGGDLQSRLEAVRGACETAIHRDETEAALRWAASLAGGPITTAITAARVAFDSKAGNLTSQLRDEVNALSVSVNAEIIPHLGVPGALSADAKHWLSLADRVRAVESSANDLTLVPGWEDKASPQYAKATRVQVDALESLELIMREVGNSCVLGEDANRAAFVEVGTLLTQGANNTRDGRAGGGAFYQRTAAAIVTVAKLRYRVAPESLAAVRRSNIIDAHATQTLASTTLPDGYWPGGNAPTGIDG